MLISNSMRFCTDIFGLVEEEEEDTGGGTTPDPTQDTEDPAEEQEVVTKPTKVEAPTYKRALLVSKTQINCANKNSVSQIIISGSQPSKSKLGFMWLINDKVYKFHPTSHALVEFTDDVTVENVLKYGNRAALLNGLTNITAFAGKRIYPIIALQAPADATEFLTAKIQVKAATTAETLTDEQITPVYEIANSTSVPRIVSMSADTEEVGTGNVTIRVKLRDGDENWSDWMTLANSADREATAVQFKFNYSVGSVDGTNSAKVNEIVVEHTLGKTVVSGDDADLYSTVIDYVVPLQLCYCSVRHNELIDSRIEASVNYMRPPSRRELIQIGVGTGQRQELVLGVGGVGDLNIDVSSIEIREDGEIKTDFDANSAASTVVLSAKKNAVIHASYDYNHDVEVWRPMTLEVTEPMTDETTYVSRYSYELPDDEAENKTIANVRLRLIRPTGKVTNYSLGKGKGRKQLFALEHIPKKSSIKFTGNVEWDYNEEADILEVTAAKNTQLTVSYSWVGEEITVYGFSAGFSLA